MKIKFKHTNFPTGEYSIVHKETGEVKDLPPGKLQFMEPTKLVTINSKEYTFLDTHRLRTLRANGIKNFEIGFLILVSDKLAFNFNILMYDDNTPHTARTIGELIGESQQSAKRKLNRLSELNVIKHTNFPGSKFRDKVYIVNPYLLRKGKNFSIYLQTLFSDFVLAGENKPLILKNPSESNK